MSDRGLSIFDDDPEDELLEETDDVEDTAVTDPDVERTQVMPAVAPEARPATTQPQSAPQSAPQSPRCPSVGR